MILKSDSGIFINKIPLWVRDTLAFLFFILFWSFIYLYTDSFPSGYHLGDDFDVARWRLEINEGEIFHALKAYLSEDLGIYIARYRPLWVIHRVFAIAAFDMNFSLYLAYIGVLAVFTSYFLYKFCIITGFSFLQSIFFSLLSLIGNASVIWFELSDSENIGMFFLSLTLYFMSKSVHSEKNITFNKFSFCLFLICMSSCKESFILFVPPILFLYLWLFSIKNKMSIFTSLKNNIFIIFIICSVFFGSLLMVKIFVLDNGPRYSGIDSGTLSKEAISGFLKTVFSLRISYLIFTGIFILTFYNLIKKNTPSIGEKFSQLKENFLNITILFLLICLPQYLNYHKSSLVNRYYLPFILGFSFYLIFLYNRIVSFVGISKSIKIFFSLLLAVLIFFELRINVIPRFRQYANDQKVTGKFLNSINSNVSKDSIILIVMEPVQQAVPGIALLVYLRDVKDYHNVKFRFSKKKVSSNIFSDTAYYNATLKRMSELYGKQLFDSIQNKNQINTVAILYEMEENFLNENQDWFKEMNFRRERYGGFVIYIKHKS